MSDLRQSETSARRRARALSAVAGCPEAVREGVAKMPFNETVTDRDREIARRLQPKAKRALAKAHGKRVT